MMRRVAFAMAGALLALGVPAATATAQDSVSVTSQVWTIHPADGYPGTSIRGIVTVSCEAGESRYLHLDMRQRTHEIWDSAFVSCTGTSQEVVATFYSEQFKNGPAEVSVSLDANQESWTTVRLKTQRRP